MTEAIQFGLLLRATRNARKLKIGQLAEMANTGAKHLGRIERGEKLPSFELIISLARVLDVSPEVFFRFEDLQTDRKTVRQRINRYLDAQDFKQLQKASRVLRALLEP